MLIATACSTPPEGRARAAATTLSQGVPAAVASLFTPLGDTGGLAMRIAQLLLMGTAFFGLYVIYVILYSYRAELANEPCPRRGL